MSKSRFAGPVIAILIVIAFSVWMASGESEPMVTETAEAEATKPTPIQENALVPRVQAVDSIAVSVQQDLIINGTTQAARHVMVASEGSGKVIAVLKSEGDSVQRGETIARLDTQDIPSQIEQARAFERQTKLEYEGALKLERQGLINEAQTAAAFASYQQSRAQLASLELMLSNTSIRAPFSGQIENSDLEIGSYVNQGDPVAAIYDYSKLVFEGPVSEKDLNKVKLGQKGTVELINGDQVDATVSYIGSVANANTRTFSVELEISDVSRKVSGITSTATVSLGEQSAHFISPALLYVNEHGDMGLKTLDTRNQVMFNAIEIVKSSTDGVWIQGLPDVSRIITVGQGFVDVGDETVPTIVDSEQTAAVGQ